MIDAYFVRPEDPRQGKIARILANDPREAAVKWLTDEDAAVTVGPSETVIVHVRKEVGRWKKPETTLKLATRTIWEAWPITPTTADPPDFSEDRS